MSDDLDKLPKRRRHLAKARLTVLGEYEPSAGSAVAIAQTVLDLEDPFTDTNAGRTGAKELRDARIRTLFRSGVTRHKEIQRALEQEGVKASTKTIARALKPR